MPTRTRSSDPDARSLGRFQGLIGRFSNDRDRAFNHNLARNVRVLQILTLVSLLRGAGKRLAGTVTCEAGRKQNFRSTGTEQAAHFLPGTVLIGGAPLWDFIQDAKFRGEVEFIFGEVEHLPAEFNQADTAAEASGQAIGLCAALAGACQVLLGPLSGPAALTLAWERWTLDAMIGIRTAHAGKTTRGGIPPLERDADGNLTLESITARGAAPPDQWNRENAIWILNYYLEDQARYDVAWVGGPGRPRAEEVRNLFRP